MIAKNSIFGVLFKHMVMLVLMVFLLLVGALAASLRPIYGVATVAELQRRAKKGDQVAAALHDVARHGVAADILLFATSLACSLVAILIMAEQFPAILAFTIGFAVIFIMTLVLPKKTSKLSRKIALKLSPYVSMLLVKIRPVIQWVAALVRRHRPVTIKTGLYEKEDLLELLEKQKVVAHNRIEATELDLASHILKFGDKKVGDHMIPKRAVHFIRSEDPIGPILLTELYDSGFSRFPVRNSEDEIVGTLFLKDLVDKKVSGIVSNVMSPAVFYVNDTSPLERVLAAFIKTKHHLFMVVNSFEEVIGVITIEDVLEEMLGRNIVDESDKFDDIRAVAAKQAASDEKDHPKP